MRTAQPVEHIAADGSRIAVAMAARKMNICDEIVVWSPEKRNVVRFYPGSNCNTAPTIDDIQELALAGKTIYWLDADGGLSISLQVFRRTLGTGRTEPVSSLGSYSLSAYQPGDNGPSALLGNLLGAGNLLVFNSWTACMEIPAGSLGATCPQAAPGDKPVILYSDQKLLKVVDGASVEIVSAPDSQISAPDVRYRTYPVTTAVAPAAVAVDANRIAAQNADGSVTIYSAAGAALQSISIPSGKFSGFALRGSQLVTIRSGRLELYNVFSGKLGKTIRVPAGALLRGLQKGLAVYVTGPEEKYSNPAFDTYVYRKIHVLRLSDGKGVTYSPPPMSAKNLARLMPGTNSVDAQIGASGLFYSYNLARGHAPGRVVFVPLAKILKKLG
ncbi:MAG: hypothetical protein WBQ14_06905 [Gaiellaceae bacterium]